MIPIAEIRVDASVNFRDVSNEYRAYKEIAYLYEGKIVQGDTGNFYPNRDVTRAEAIALIGRAIGLNGTKRITQFTDVPVSSFASGYIQSAAEKSIVASITQDKMFKPNQPITRGEMALVINVAFGYQEKGQLTIASDRTKTDLIQSEVGTGTDQTLNQNETTQIGSDVALAANNLKVRGIAQGITQADFGYDMKIKRADFAVFLARAINYKLRILPSIIFIEEKYVIAEDFLNVRTGPATTFEKISELLPGTKVSTAYNVGDWVYIKAENIEGLVHKDYLSPTYSPDSSPVNTGVGGTPIEGPANPMSQQVIMIDPGHGGKDPGAIGYGINESNVVLDVSLRLKALLEKTPFQYELTREIDIFNSLEERVKMAKNSKTNIFISIHANTFNGNANGTESYYFKGLRGNQNWESSQTLAKLIQERLIEEWSLTDRGVKNGDLHVLRENNMTAVLLELGFIDNPKDSQKLKSPEWRQKAAVAIYYGILDYYKNKGYNVTNLYTL